MPPFIDLTGQKFNRLTILKCTNKRDSRGMVIWKCICDCGKYWNACSADITNGHTKSCGCLMKELARIRSRNNRKNVNGEIINGIKIIRRSEKLDSRGRRPYCIAICPICDYQWETNLGNIKNGQVTQCDSCRNKQHISKTASLLLDSIEQRFNVKILREYKLENKYFDGYIPEKNILIESDGSYFHSKEKDKQNDLLKDKIAAEHGINLIRFKNDSPKDIPPILNQLTNTIL